MSEASSNSLPFMIAGCAFAAVGLVAVAAAAFLVGSARPAAPPAPIIVIAPSAPPAPAPTPGLAPALTPAPAPVQAPAPAPGNSEPRTPNSEPRPVRTFRQALGLNLEDVALLESPVTFGSGSVGVMDKAPKIISVSGDTAMAKVGVKTGERVYQVDGRPVERAQDVWNVVDKKTIPGEVRLKIGPTKYDARDVKIEISE